LSAVEANLSVGRMWQKLYQTLTGGEFLLISGFVSDCEEEAQDTLQGGSGYKCSFGLQN